MNKLLISVYSFGFQKSGIPENEFDDGGGFVFDCRFLPNPFNDPKLRDYTGLDKEIKHFFSDYRSVKSFIEDSFRMVEKAANSYIERDFKNLQVSFGCTGGRHRSVYCSGEFCRMLESKGFNVRLAHTEI
jgi:RNase adaptor protein for sRNA GlmZ degradation